MTHGNRAVQVGGTWLAIASLSMIATLGFHGSIAPDHNDHNEIADAALRWSVVHWIAAAGLSLYAVTGLVILTSGSRLTKGWWTMTVWAVISVGALWTMTTAVAETTVVANAAVSGSSETFEALWAFAEGKANGFAFLALAVAVSREMRLEVPREPRQRGRLGRPWLRALPPSPAGLWGCGSRQASEAPYGWHPPA